MVTLQYVSVDINEIKENECRLEASVFSVNARKAQEILRKCKFPIVMLWSANGLIGKAFYPLRFKRIYVDDCQGIAMLLPSEMLELRPKPTKFISHSTKTNIDSLKSELNTLLLSRSGTIGNCTIVSEYINNMVLSDDIIRIYPNNVYDLGYVYAYLKTEVGITMLATNNYGAVIQHIEPEHLTRVPIPNPTEEIKQEIHDLIMRSFDLRDQYNELIDEAEAILKQELNLPPSHELKPKYFEKIQQYNPSITNQDIKAFSVSTDLLENRFDASYHIPVVNEIMDILLDNAESITPLEYLVSEITLPTRFKRYYVEDSGVGMLLIGGKQINEIEPTTKKYISIKGHSAQIKKELLIKENTILITRSGTIGKVTITPKYWENWIPSDHIIRVIPKDSKLAGYIFLVVLKM